MSNVQLLTTNHKLLYEGQHTSIKQAVEFAYSQNIPLHGIDLKGKNLQGINLDGITLHSGNFSEANLQGANLSEATFKSCDFSSSNLRDSCFCYSNMLHCNFRLSDFSEGDLSMASIENSEFEGFSSLAFNLHKAFKRQALTFIHFEKNIPILDIPTFITSGDIMIIKIGKYMILNEIPHTFEYDFPLKSITK